MMTKASIGKTVRGLTFTTVIAVVFACGWLQSPRSGHAQEEKDQAAQAQESPTKAQKPGAGVFIPNFVDPNTGYGQPDVSRIIRLKFLTTTDFPPFNFLDGKNRLSGFHIDLARAICEKLSILARCQIQALPFDKLEDQLLSGNAEALIAGHAITAAARKKMAFSDVYLRIPARFMVRRDSTIVTPMYEGLFKKLTGVVKGSAHAEYMKDVFAGRQTREYPSREALFTALKDGEIDAAFSDAVSIGFWQASEDANNCCRFIGGPYLSEKYFGSGLAIALPKDRNDLEIAINAALKMVNDSGEFAELYLRYFPLGMY